MKRAVGLVIAVSLSCGAWAQKLPNLADSFRFAVIGDSGTGGRAQYEIGARLAQSQKILDFKIVVMLGDNIYGGQTPNDFQRKFELPYKALLDSGVKFHAALGNHDSLKQSSYKPFNMGGSRYYTFRPQSGIRFFAVDTTLVDQRQLEWLEKELAGSRSEWKIVYLHHPIYSSGAMHGSTPGLRAVLGGRRSHEPTRASRSRGGPGRVRRGTGPALPPHPRRSRGGSRQRGRRVAAGGEGVRPAGARGRAGAACS